MAAFADEPVEVRRLKDFQLVRELPLVQAPGFRNYYQFIKSVEGLYLLRTDGDIDYLEEGTVQASTRLSAGRTARAVYW